MNRRGTRLGAGRRSGAARWGGCVAGLLVLCALALGPRCSRAAGTVRLGDVTYINAVRFGARFGLDPRVGNQGRTLDLTSKWTQLEFQADNRECQINGLRVFLGNAARLHRGDMMIDRIDAEKLITPILLPGAGQTRVPDLKTIVLDPGHGGKDPGMMNRAQRLEEKNLTLDTARRLQKILQADGYKVLLTRDRDEYVGLEDRVTQAQRAGADLFISLHYNAVTAGVDSVTGVEVYTLSPQYQYSTSDPEHDDDRRAAQAFPGNGFDHWNTILGYQVMRKMVQDLRVPDRGLKRGRLAVLRDAPCPAILVECGFVSNPREARKIATPAYRQEIAEAITEGVRAYANILAGIRRQQAQR